jgi:hypothetical protein
MTEPTAPAVNASVEPNKASFWEDLIDIFYKPSEVFARRRNASAQAPFWFVVIAMGVISFVTFTAIAPAIEGDLQRTIPKLMAKNPQMTQEMADRMVQMQTTVGRYFAPVVLAAIMFIVGVVTWIVSKIFGAVESFGAAVLITSYAYLPRVVGMVIVGAQALLMDPAKLTSVNVLTVGPSRFMDPVTANPFALGLAQRLDVFIIWETVLLAIGVAVIGKLPRGKAIAFGVLMWVLGSLPAIRQAYVMM